VAHIRVAPADHKGLQSVFERVLHKAVGRAQVENVVLVDLRRHDQQWLGVLFFAHGLVLDQLQQLIAKHHRARGGGNRLANFERVLAHLAWQTVVVQQVFEQIGHTAHHAVAAGVEQLFDGQRVEQGVGGGDGIVEQGEGEVCAGPVIGAQGAVVDPVTCLLLPAQIGLQTSTVERVELPGGIAEAAVMGVGLVHGLAQQHPTQLAAQGPGMPGGVHRVAQAVSGDAAQGREQVPAPEAGDRILRIDERSRGRRRVRHGSFSHEPTLLRLAIKQARQFRTIVGSWQVARRCVLTPPGVDESLHAFAPLPRTS